VEIRIYGYKQLVQLPMSFAKLRSILQ